MSGDMILSGNNALALPDYLQGANLGVSEGLLATIGVGGNRISLKGNRFRQYVNGKEEGVWETTYADFIVLGAVPAISRIYYEGAYDPDTKAAPTCYSADGIAPPDDVKNKQASKCEACPQNQKGSKIVNGTKIKACSYFQRLIVMVAGDPEGIMYQLDVKSMGIFGESHAATNKYNIRDYTKLLTNRGVDIAQVVTRMSFDLDSSVPKLLFTAARFIEKDEYELVASKVGSEEIKRMLQINMSTIDLSGEVDADEAKVIPSTTVAEPAAEVSSKPVPATPAPASAGKVVMTEKAGAVTYEQFVQEGWSDDEMVAEGYATRPEPPKAASAPPKPAAPAVPPKRGPGRPPSAAKPAAPTPTAPAAKPAPSGPVKPTAGSPAPAPTRPVPTVTKAHPVPTAEPEAVQETTTDAEVENILASLV